MTTSQTQSVRIYDGEGAALFLETGLADKLVLAHESQAIGEADAQPRLRLMWGQYLLDDLLAGRYNSLVCAANPDDINHGIVGQLAAMLPGSQWTPESVTAHARQFAKRDEVTVLKYDMGLLEVLALLRPSQRDVMTLDDLSHGFGLITQLLKHHSEWRPTATVSILEGRANRLEDASGAEPSFESILRTIYDAGYAGDVYPSPAMFEATPTAVFSRYPFPASLEQMRAGGF